MKRRHSSGLHTVAGQVDEPERLVLGVAIVKSTQTAGTRAIEVDGLSSAGCSAAFGEGSGGLAGSGRGDREGEGVEEGGLSCVHQLQTKHRQF